MIGCWHPPSMRPCGTGSTACSRDQKVEPSGHYRSPVGGLGVTPHNESGERAATKAVDLSRAKQRQRAARAAQARAGRRCAVTHTPLRRSGGILHDVTKKPRRKLSSERRFFHERRFFERRASTGIPPPHTLPEDTGAGPVHVANELQQKIDPMAMAYVVAEGLAADAVREWSIYAPNSEDRNDHLTKVYDALIQQRADTQLRADPL